MHFAFCFDYMPKEHVVECGDLNRYHPPQAHVFECLAIESCIIRMCDLTGHGVMCYCGHSFSSIIYAQGTPSDPIHFL